MPVWVLVAGVLLLAAVAYWQLVVAEGAYLGAPVVALLYDWTASRYDRIKQFQPDDEEWFLARPLREAMRMVPEPLVLDVGTGTGRLPAALFTGSDFRGQVVGLDLSRGMLRQAQRKLNGAGERTFWLWSDAMELPFEADAFDAVVCLEALEFTPDPRQVVREMVRVLRPGGLLLVTNRVGRQSRLLPGRTYDEAAFRDILEGAGLRGVHIGRWQVAYDQAWARKPGWVAVGGDGPLPARLQGILRCPVCGHAGLVGFGDEAAPLACRRCGADFPREGNLVYLHQKEMWAHLWWERAAERED